MSCTQFHSIKLFILRHAWLNLWDKHMTTGRINQVTFNIKQLFNIHWSITKNKNNKSEFRFENSIENWINQMLPSHFEDWTWKESSQLKAFHYFRFHRTDQKTYIFQFSSAFVMRIQWPKKALNSLNFSNYSIEKLQLKRLLKNIYSGLVIHNDQRTFRFIN